MKIFNIIVNMIRKIKLFAFFVDYGEEQNFSDCNNHGKFTVETKIRILCKTQEILTLDSQLTNSTVSVCYFLKSKGRV